MFQRLLKLVAWTGLCFIAYATLSPLRDRPILLTSLKLEHLAAFAMLGTLFCLAYPRRTLAVLLIVLGSAALLELLQFLTRIATREPWTHSQKMIGGAAGVFAGRVVLCFDRARFWLLRASNTPFTPGNPLRGWPASCFPYLSRKAANISRRTNLPCRRMAKAGLADSP